jgi:hypothetical protein
LKEEKVAKSSTVNLTASFISLALEGTLRNTEMALDALTTRGGDRDKKGRAGKTKKRGHTKAGEDEWKKKKEIMKNNT